MGKLINDLEHVKKDVEHIHDDVEHVIKDIESCNVRPKCPSIDDLLTHLKNIDVHLHDLLSHVSHIKDGEHPE